MAARAQKVAEAPREHIFCPRCAKAYRIDADSLGAEGRQVRCKTCEIIWFEPPKGEHSAARVISPHFASKLKLYLNYLPEHVRQNSARTTTNSTRDDDNATMSAATRSATQRFTPVCSNTFA